MTTRRSKSKPDVEFQYGGRQFQETGSSFILATDWDVSSKFGKQVDFHLTERVPSLKPNPEVDCCLLLLMMLMQARWLQERCRSCRRRHEEDILRVASMTVVAQLNVVAWNWRECSADTDVDMWWQWWGWWEHDQCSL